MPTAADILNLAEARKQLMQVNFLINSSEARALRRRRRGELMHAPGVIAVHDRMAQVPLDTRQCHSILSFAERAAGECMAEFGDVDTIRRVYGMYGQQNDHAIVDGQATVFRAEDYTEERAAIMRSAFKGSHAIQASLVMPFAYVGLGKSTDGVSLLVVSKGMYVGGAANTYTLPVKTLAQSHAREALVAAVFALVASTAMRGGGDPLEAIARDVQALVRSVPFMQDGSGVEAETPFRGTNRAFVPWHAEYLSFYDELSLDEAPVYERCIRFLQPDFMLQSRALRPVPEDQLDEDISDMSDASDADF